MPCHDRNGRTAIFSVRGGGEGVYRERGCYFRTFHSSSINSEVGPTDPKLYFCNYFGAAFSFNVHGRLEQAALPLSATRQSPGEAGTGCWGWGRRGGRAGWGRWVPIDKETKVSPFGQMVAQVGTSVWGGEGTPFSARVLFERLAQVWALWDPAREPGCSTQGDSVAFVCTLARWVRGSGKEETISLH